MNITFILDVKLKYDGKNYYTTGAADYNYFCERKMNKNNNLMVICRDDDTDNAENQLAMSSGEKVEILAIRGYKRLVQKETRKNISKAIKNSDIVIIKLPTFLGLYACHICRKMDKKYTIEMVGSPFHALKYKGGIISKIIAPLISLINKYYIKRAFCVKYVSNKFLQKKYPTKGNAFSISDVLLKKISNEEVLKRRIDKINRLKMKENSIKIGLIGSLDVQYKGHITAIKAIKLLKKIFNNNIELHFVGSGNKKKWQKIARENNVEENIIFHGSITHEKIYEWFSNIDIYIIPSLTEGMPRALIEAMSSGCPCIGTNVGGIPELLDKDMLIKKKDYKELAKKIANLVEEKDKMIYNANKNFEISKEYQKNILDEKRKNFYEYILKEVENDKSITSSK